MSMTVTDLRISASLIDEYLQTEAVPVGTGLSKRFLVVQRTSGGQAVSEVLSVNPAVNSCIFIPTLPLIRDDPPLP